MSPPDWDMQVEDWVAVLSLLAMLTQSFLIFG
jgi:hypothetical protein